MSLDLYKQLILVCEINRYENVIELLKRKPTTRCIVSDFKIKLK